jgi:hypothetical protein
MRKWIAGAAIIALAVFVGSSLLLPNASAEGQRTFVGAGKCKTCHKKAEDGDQFGKWAESAHANAYATLATDEAKKIATDKGLGNPQEAAECLSCHVTGYGVAAEFHGSKYDMTEGVSCESCHGAGGDYYKKSVMKAITAGETDGATVGLVTPDEKTCTGCHNDKSPTFTAFNFDEMVKKIAHPKPKAE